VVGHVGRRAPVGQPGAMTRQVGSGQFRHAAPRHDSFRRCQYVGVTPVPGFWLILRLITVFIIE
jgi:hypothetical protein